MTDQPSPGKARVLIVRSRATGEFLRFADPDRRNAPIKRTVAAERLRVSGETGRLVDSFGNEVGVGALSFPERSYIRTIGGLTQASAPYEGDISKYVPKPNEEIIERVTFTKKDGTVGQGVVSYKMGRKYDKSKSGGWWRNLLTEGVDPGEGKRIPTNDLAKMVLHSEFIIRRTY